ncbi:MAG: hypothetical protein HGA65_10695 [Oscillochloris sp.]|nr:hypothetical protein [Oscillochloris sp.]
MAARTGIPRCARTTHHAEGDVRTHTRVVIWRLAARAEPPDLTDAYTVTLVEG